MTEPEAGPPVEGSYISSCRPYPVDAGGFMAVRQKIDKYSMTGIFVYFCFLLQRHDGS
jgi:hypothetical protein